MLTVLDPGRLEHLKFTKGSVSTGVIVSEMELKNLLQYLNEAEKSEQKKVLAILQQMLDLANIEPEKYRRPEIERRKAVLNIELSRYRFTPFVLTDSASNRLSVIWHRDWCSEIE